MVVRSTYDSMFTADEWDGSSKSIDHRYYSPKYSHGRTELGIGWLSQCLISFLHDGQVLLARGEARSEKTLVPDFIISTLDSKFPSKALINNTVI